MSQWEAYLAPSETGEFPNPAVAHHDKTGKGDETFLGYVHLHYPTCQTVEDWTYYSQLNQRDALRYGIEHFRHSEFCRGSLIWQFNDCWPVSSWAVQDYGFLLKPAGFELHRLYADLLLSAEFLIGQPSIGFWISNDSTRALSGRLHIAQVDTRTGETKLLKEVDWNLGSNERSIIDELEVAGFDPRTTAIHAYDPDYPDLDRWVLLAEPKEIQLAEPNITVVDRGDELDVEVQGFVLDLVVWDNGVPARVVSPKVGQAGWDARTVANGTLRYRQQGKAVCLKARSMFGHHALSNSK